jgi:hypothetical protein
MATGLQIQNRYPMVVFCSRGYFSLGYYPHFGKLSVYESSFDESCEEFEIGIAPNPSMGAFESQFFGAKLK